MMATDENALICDFAETYGVMDWRALPIKTAATLAAGLRPDARIVQKMSGMNISIDTMLRAYMADRIAFIAWSKTKDAQHNTGRPKSVLELLMGKSADESKGFDTPEEFDAWRAKMIGG